MTRFSFSVLGVCALLAGCSTAGGESGGPGSVATTVADMATVAPTISEVSTTTVSPPAESTTTTIAGSTTATTAVTEPSRPTGDPVAPAALAFTLPEGFEYPEGIAVDPATGRAYVTATPSGAVAVAEPDADAASIWLPAGTDGRTYTFGIEFDRDSVWLVSPPAIWEYGVDGVMRGHHVADSDGLNDLAVTEQGVYVTDTDRAVLWFLPRGSSADEPLVPIDLSTNGPVGQLNGIEALEDGTLVAVHFFNGNLFHIDARSPSEGITVETIDLGGFRLTYGDGMRALGDVLWVTRGRASDSVDRVTLCPSHTCGTVVAGAKDPALSFPTDVEIRGDQLLVVNSQFWGLLGGAPPTKPFTVSAIPRSDTTS